MADAYQQRGPTTQYDSPAFDPAAVFQVRQDNDAMSVLSGGNAVIDEEELIKAARAELKAKRGHLTRNEKSKIAQNMLAETEGVKFATRMAQIAKQKPGGFPTVEVSYRDVHLHADALVGSGSNPSVWNSTKSMISRLTFRGGLETRPVEILSGVNGVIKPGRLTLLLGPPGAGKSVFLQLLSGRLRMHKGLRVTGDVRYNGEDINKFVVQRTAGLVDQYDYNIPNLTVIETVKFAANCQTTEDDVAKALAAVEKATIQQNATNASAPGIAAVESTDLSGFEMDVANTAAEEGTSAGPSATAAAAAGADGGDTDDSTSATNAAAADSSAHAEQEFLEMYREAVLHRIKPYLTLHLLGLSNVAETFVGNENLRGVSGGERKRVTSAEVLVGPQWAIFMDEISTGLDSATTYSVISSLGEICHALQRTIVISLLQPPPEVMGLFDDLLLMTDGKVIYHGHIAEATKFFADIGFVCPERKDPASFLQEVTTPMGQLTYATEALLNEHKVPAQLRDPSRLLTNPPKKLIISVDQIADAFWASSQGRNMQATLDASPQEPTSEGAGALARTHYARSGYELAWLALRRQMLLVKRDKAYYIARVVQAVVMGLIISSVFASVSPPSASNYDMTTTAGQQAYSSEVFSQGRKVLSLCVISVIYLSMSSMPAMGFVFNTKRVFYKHRDNHFFPPWSYVISLLLAQSPSSTLESIVYTVVVYFISGLTRTAACFFIFLVVTWSASNCLAGVFRLIAFLAANMVIANAFGALCLLFLMITNGFSIIRTSIPGYLIWIYYGFNPLAYAIRSLAINELTQPAWGSQGPAILESFGFFTEDSWIWIGVGFMWGFLVLATLAGALALKYTNPSVPLPTVPLEEQKKEVANQLNDYVKRAGGNFGGRFIGGGSISPEASGPSATSDVALQVEQVGGAKGVYEAEGDDEVVEVPAKKFVVPHTPIALVCRDICYYVNDPSSGMAPGVVKDSDDKEIAGKLQLLKRIDFYAEPGQLTALMGGSGAGKTTLMDVVAGRKTQGLIRGEILVNGRPKEQATWSRVVGYVEQMDIHSSRITVRESLQFSARLRLDETTVSDAQVLDVVETTLDTVELRSLANSIVGDAGADGLSIEQRKRLSIAVELVANPSVLFMDEPTSGLDARAAAIVMRSVRNVANGNRTVMVTIHQPSMEIFEAFDQLVLLQRGGRLTYFGPLGVESTDLIAYLEGYQGVAPIKPGYNPATWMLEVTGGSMATAFKAADLDFPVEYLNSEARSANLKKMEVLAAEGAANSLPLAVGGKYATCYSTQARELLRKYFAYYWRAPNYNFVRIMITLFIALIYGLTYLNEGKALAPGSQPAEISTVQNIMGLIFSMAIFNGMFNCMTVMPVIYAERVVFYRERAASMYAPRAIALAQGIAELPYLAVQAVVMVCIAYWMVGFQPIAWKFFYFMLMFFLTVTMYTFLGQFLVVATPNPLIAQLLAAFCNQFFTIMNGFLVTKDQMPTGWKWAWYVSPTSWILYGLGGSQLADSTVCFNASNTPPVPGAPCQQTVGEFVQSFFGYDPDFIWWCPLILFGYIFFFRTASVMVFAYVDFNKR